MWQCMWVGGSMPKTFQQTEFLLLGCIPLLSLAGLQLTFFHAESDSLSIACADSARLSRAPGGGLSGRHWDGAGDLLPVKQCSKSHSG